MLRTIRQTCKLLLQVRLSRVEATVRQRERLRVREQLAVELAAEDDLSRVLLVNRPLVDLMLSVKRVWQV